MNTSLAVIGSGKMGEIISAGILASGKLSPDQIIATDVAEHRLAEMASRHGLRTTTDNLEAVKASGVVLVAVKPQDMEALLRSIAVELRSDQLVISIAAGISTQFIESLLPPGAAVVRVMPNAAAQVREAMAAVCGGSHATEEHLAAAEALLSSVGRVLRVPEAYMDSVTALSGSGPAYFALFAEAMIDAGVMAGLPRTLAAELVAQTMVGTAALMREGGMQPVQVREAVTSPGGTTAMAVRELEQGGVRAAILNAVQAAADRSRDLASKPKPR